MSSLDFSGSKFFANLAEKRLVGSQCKKCGKTFFPPRPMCAECHSGEMETVTLSGKGKLAAYTVIYVGTSAMNAAGYDRKTPYCTGVVELAEGPCISAQILGVDVAKPETIQIGTELTVAFIERGEGDAKKISLGFQA